MFDKCKGLRYTMHNLNKGGANTMGAVLTFLFYFTPDQVSHGTPDKATMKFDSFAECETYVEIHKPEMDKELIDGLLGYSARCSVE